MTPHRLNTRIQGKGFPILCLHGHPGSGKTMSVFTERLSQQYQTIAPDLRGYGKSSTSKPFAMTEHLTDLLHLMDAQSIESCVVLGWSLGGILAMELALAAPHRVAGLVLLATAAHPRGAHPPIAWQDNAMTAIAALANQVWVGAPWLIEKFGKRSLFRYLVKQHTPQVYQRLATEGVEAYLNTSTSATDALQTALSQGYNNLSAVQSITCPVLVLAAEDDVHITAASSLETASQFSNCQIRCYPDTAHLFPWEISEQVLNDIESWLAVHLSSREL